MKRALLLVVTFLATLLCYAQKAPTDYPEVVPPAPSVASLMRFEEVPIDYYTGQPNISIPLGNVSINKDLSYPIVLQYNTQGIRVEERSGWTGTGFSMALGGVISRTIQGIPDELNHQYGGIGIFHLTEMMDYNGLSQADKVKFLWETNNGETKKDAMYDLFQYSFFGNMGRFIIEKTTNGLEAKIIGNETNHKIEISYDANFNLTSFVITDTKGYIYTFDEVNQVDVQTVTVTSAQYASQGTNVSTSTTDMTGSQSVPNAWYLTKVESPVEVNTSGTFERIELCSFSYSPVTEDYNIPTTYATNTIIGTPNFGSNSTTESTNKGMTLPKTTEVSQEVTSIQKYVSTVTMRDSTKVEYSFSSNHPEFLSGGAKLNSIIIREPNDSINKKIDLIYEISTHNRLFLKTIRETYGSEQLEYTLAYNNKNSLPAFEKDQQDAFGYYKDNPDPFLADPNDATTGVLTSITYPTGGKKEFVFESNSYAFLGNTPVNTYDIPTNYTTVSYGDQFYYNDSQQNSGVSTDKYVVYIENNGSIDLFANLITDNTTGSAPFSFAHHNIRFVSVSPNFGSGISTPPSGGNGGYNPNDFYDDGGLDYTFDINFGIQPISVTTGWYMIELHTPNPILYSGNDAWNFTMEIAVKVREFVLNSYNQLGGGIRIKEVNFTDRGQEQRKIEYFYNENHYSSNLGSVSAFKSSGSFEHDPNNRSYTRYITHPFVDNTCGANQINIVPTTIQYRMNISRTQSVTPNTKGNYVGYKYVVRKETGNGKENFTYISPRDEEILTSLNTSYPFKPADNLDYRRGVLSEKEILDETGRVLEKETYTYTDINTVVKASIFPYEASLSGGGTCAWDQFYLNYTNYINEWVDNPITSCGFASGGPNTYQYCQNDSDMAATSYNHTIGILLQNIVTKTQYYYDGTNTTPTESVVTSQEMTYNSKYRIQSQITKMDKAGSVEELKKEIYYPYNLPSGSGFEPTEITIFNQMNALNIIANPVLTINYRNADTLSVVKTPYADFSITNHSAKNYRPSKVIARKGEETDYTQIDFFDYDDHGNLLEVAKEEGTEVIYIWGYNNTLPIAKIENAKLSDIPTSIYNDIINKSNLDHLNGTVITENTLKAALETLRNDASMANAMVTTFTYDPIVGVTSITDPRGESIFYEYDDHHRLKFVKDAYGHIVSSNQYYYRN